MKPDFDPFFVEKVFNPKLTPQKNSMYFNPKNTRRPRPKPKDLPNE